LSPEAEGENHAALAPDLRERIAALDPAELSRELNVGVPTLRDIARCAGPPRPRPAADLPGPVFKQGILKLDDLQPGMELRGRCSTLSISGRSSMWA